MAVNLKKEKVNVDEINAKFEEVLNMQKVGELVFSKVVTTNNDKDRMEIKEFCVQHKMDIEPLDREFIKHRITIREYSMKDFVEKVYILLKR